MTSPTKHCPSCELDLEYSEFSRDRRTRTGLKCHCKTCSHGQEIERRYGLTLKEYNAMFAEQEGKCALCGKHQSLFKNRLHVDHNHETGKVRALLCVHCNSSIGTYELYKDKIEKYLEEHE